MIEETYADLQDNFQGAFDALGRELDRVRTGRANVKLLDGIRVQYYGQPTPLNQVANLQVPEARLIMIKPWEASLLKEIERAIQQSELGLNPANDGHVIRLRIPQLTEERRRDLVRHVGKLGEDAKVAIRNHRRDANALLKTFEKDSDITEDNLQRALKHVQELTDEATKKVDGIVAEKESELMEV